MAGLILFILGAILFLILSFLAHASRHKALRIVLFYISLIIFSLGVFFFFLTYKDFTHNQIQIILLKHSPTFSRFEYSKTFTIAVIVNTLLALIMTVGGVLKIVNSILKTDFKFTK